MVIKWSTFLSFLSCILLWLHAFRQWHQKIMSCINNFGLNLQFITMDYTTPTPNKLFTPQTLQWIIFSDSKQDWFIWFIGVNGFYVHFNPSYMKMWDRMQMPDISKTPICPENYEFLSIVQLWVCLKHPSVTNKMQMQACNDQQCPKPEQGWTCFSECLYDYNCMHSFLFLFIYLMPVCHFKWKEYGTINTSSLSEFELHTQGRAD